MTRRGTSNISPMRRLFRGTPSDAPRSTSPGVPATRLQANEVDATIGNPVPDGMLAVIFTTSSWLPKSVTTPVLLWIDMAGVLTNAEENSTKPGIEARPFPLNSASKRRPLSNVAANFDCARAPTEPRSALLRPSTLRPCSTFIESIFVTYTGLPNTKTSRVVDLPANDASIDARPGEMPLTTAPWIVATAACLLLNVMLVCWRVLRYPLFSCICTFNIALSYCTGTDPPIADNDVAEIVFDPGYEGYGCAEATRFPNVASSTSTEATTVSCLKCTRMCPLPRPRFLFALMVLVAVSTSNIPLTSVRSNMVRGSAVTSTVLSGYSSSTTTLACVGTPAAPAALSGTTKSDAIGGMSPLQSVQAIIKEFTILTLAETACGKETLAKTKPEATTASVCLTQWSAPSAIQSTFKRLPAADEAMKGTAT